MPYCERKSGPFQDWTEDDAQAELFLPIPADSIKKDIICVITADKLLVKHLKLGETLLHAEPLSGPVLAEESTWYLQGDVLNIVLAKQWRGETKSDQYWGASLATKAGGVWCYMSVPDVKKHRKRREERDKEEENERHARFKASQRQERAKREAVASEEARRRQRLERAKSALAEDEDSANAAQRPSRRRVAPAKTSWFTVPVAIGLGAAFLIAVEIAIHYSQWSSAMGHGRAGERAPQAQMSDPWYDEEHD